METLYVDALEKQVLQMHEILGERRFSRFALGGGTPTKLDVDNLRRVLVLADEALGADIRNIPGSIEVSPETVENPKLDLLADYSIDRISIGVQSFLDEESRAVFRPQKQGDVRDALERIRARNFPILNLDLMYGLPEQTHESFLYSLEAALEYEPEEFFLYPLYIRPLTGYGRKLGIEKKEGAKEHYGTREDFYEFGRSILLKKGYEQVSLRMFRSRRIPHTGGPDYSCQSDGMVGLGCGARSYTRELHYSYEYGVERSATREILEEFIKREDFSKALHGYTLDLEDQKRRYLIQSLLCSDGIDFVAYGEYFQFELLDDFPELKLLLEKELAVMEGNRMVLSPEGYRISDSLGPWLFSESVRRAMEDYQLR